MKNRTFCILILVLVSIDQIIKLIVHNFCLNCEFEVIPSILDFKPTFNHKYFYINSLFDLGDGFWMHVVGCIVAFIIMILIGFYFKKKKQDSFIFKVGLGLCIAGLISALVCTIVWGGTLDYLYSKPYFVFDLKDVYLNSCAPCFILHSIVQYKNNKKSPI